MFFLAAYFLSSYLHLSSQKLKVKVPSSILRNIIFFEGWSYLDAIYYAVISLTTIGFGDLIPRNQPPESQASHIRNESACLCELINPVPSNDINNKTGLSKLCNPVSMKLFFNSFRFPDFEYHRFLEKARMISFLRYLSEKVTGSTILNLIENILDRMADINWDIVQYVSCYGIFLDSCRSNMAWWCCFNADRSSQFERLISIRFQYFLK